MAGSRPNILLFMTDQQRYDTVSAYGLTEICRTPLADSLSLLVERVFAVIDQLRGRGVSILLVEQHAYGALEIVDRAYVLENGHIVLEGTPAALKQDERVRAAYLGG
jgi:ABC-type lipopolysaccharide export system ATPase subunit